MKEYAEAAAGAPALVPLHGVLDKKPRRLTREVMTIGRARGCDIGLEGPDISSLHCILFLSGQGWRIRDCGSRTGTRVNGGPARGQLLQDGDVLHLGQFSFRVEWGESPQYQHARSMVDPQEFDRLARSRRRALELALRFRKRLSAGKGGNRSPDEEALRARETELKKRIRTYDNRLGQLEAAERELEKEREELRRENETLLERVRSSEADLARRLEDAEEEIHKRRREFQQRCVQEEGAAQRRIAEELQNRQAELRERIRGLEEREQQVVERSAELDAAAERLRREREELDQMKETHPQRNGESLPQESFREAEAALREQRKDLLRMMEDLKELQQAIRAQQSVDVAALQRENAELSLLVEELQTRPALEDVAVLQREHAELARLVEELQARPQASGEGALDLALLEEMGTLRNEAEKLRKLVEEQAQELERLRAALAERNAPAAAAAKPGGSLGSLDLETFEAELVRERQQMEKERAKLDAEIEQLRLRNEELDEATREMEMELSRERAELARERQRLDRMREEIRSGTERDQREATMRESLAPVQKLREEIQGKRGSANGLSDRVPARNRNE